MRPLHFMRYFKRRKPWDKRDSWSFGAKYGFMAGALLLLPLLLVFGIELIQRGSLHETWSWVYANPKLYELNALLTLFVFVFFYGLIGSLLPSAAVTTLLMSIFALISFFKTKLIGEPFFPWDILLNKEGGNIIPLVTGKEALKRLAVVFAVVAGLFLLRLKLPRFRLPIVGRLALVALSLFSLYSFGLRSPWASSMIYRAGVNEIPWNQQENYGNNGTALAFTMNVKNSIVPKPDNYGESTIADLASQITGTKAEAKAAAAPADPFGGKKPNVIFIMNEAFWDPTLLPGVTYSEDPVPTIHQLQKESTSGYLLSPQFGGGTSNVEFEVLTGNSMSFLPAGSVPYEQYVNKPTPSLASYFDSQGYKSMGIHSYDGWFWNRNNVYKQLGFETFKSKEHFDNPEYAGPFISDAEVSRNIIKEVDSTDRSMFIYAVTMQNHGGYDGDRYPGGNPIKAQGSLTPDAKQILENYTHGARDADQSLKMLIDHFQQSDEPTVIVFYGDHLPMLGMDYDVYKQGGFIPTSNTEQWTDEENRKMHSVPFVVWSNVNLPTKQYPTLSDAFLGANMLDLMGMEAPAPFRYNLEFSKQFPGLLRNLVIDGQGNLHKNVPETLQAQVNQFRDLQYDNLFGKRYLAKFLDQEYLNKDSLPNYNAEFGGTSPPASPKGKGAS